MLVLGFKLAFFYLEDAFRTFGQAVQGRLESNRLASW